MLSSRLAVSVAHQFSSSPSNYSRDQTIDCHGPSSHLNSLAPQLSPTLRSPTVNIATYLINQTCNAPHRTLCVDEHRVKAEGTLHNDPGVSLKEEGTATVILMSHLTVWNPFYFCRAGNFTVFLYFMRSFAVHDLHRSCFTFNTHPV